MGHNDTKDDMEMMKLGTSKKVAQADIVLLVKDEGVKVLKNRYDQSVIVNGQTVS